MENLRLKRIKIDFQEGSEFLERVLLCEVGSKGFVDKDGPTRALPPSHGYDFVISNMLCTDVRFGMFNNRNRITIRFGISYERVFQYHFPVKMHLFYKYKGYPPEFNLDLTEGLLKPIVWKTYTGHFKSEKYHGCTNGTIPMSRLAYLFRITRQPFDYPMLNRVPFYQICRRLNTIAKVLVKLSVHPHRDQLAEAMDEMGRWKENMESKRQKIS